VQQVSETAMLLLPPWPGSHRACFGKI